MLTHDYAFISNTPDDLHCFQAVLRMAWQGLLAEPLSATEADRMTAFKQGKQTWPFRGMLALADAGASVQNIEDFDPACFLIDPRAEMLRQMHGNAESVDYAIKVADPARELDVIRQLIDHPRVAWTIHPPSVDELLYEVHRPGTAVICNVNYRALAGSDGYSGHFVLVEPGSHSDSLTLQDPGLPPSAGQVVTIEAFTTAWLSPDPGIANIISASV